MRLINQRNPRFWVGSIFPPVDDVFNAADWLEHVLQFLAQHRVKPHQGAVYSVANFLDPKSSERLISLEAMRRSLSKIDPTEIYLVSLESSERTVFGSRGIQSGIHIVLHHRLPKEIPAAQECEINFYVKASCVSVPESFFSELCELVVPMRAAKYGFMTERKLLDNARGYVGGIISVEPGQTSNYNATTTQTENELRAWREASRWEWERGVSRLDLLRNVYEFNLLSPRHLALRVAGVPLRDWISDSLGQYGALRTGDGTSSSSIWVIPSNLLSGAREALRASQLLVEYLREPPFKVA